jgi:hypothetical protein
MICSEAQPMSLMTIGFPIAIASNAASEKARTRTDTIARHVQAVMKGRTSCWIDARHVFLRRAASSIAAT